MLMNYAAYLVRGRLSACDSREKLQTIMEVKISEKKYKACKGVSHSGALQLP